MGMQVVKLHWVNQYNEWKMFNVKLVSHNLADFNDCEDIEIHFSKSIEFNPNLDLEISKVYQWTLNNRAKFILGCFHLNVFENMGSIVRNNNESDDFWIYLNLLQITLMMQIQI